MTSPIPVVSSNISRRFTNGIPTEVEGFSFLIPDRPVEPDAAPITMADLVRAYLDHCQVRFRKYGRQTRGYDTTKVVMRLLLATGIGTFPIGWFGPVWLDQFRVWLASHPERRWARKTIANYARMVAGMIRWAVSQQLTTESHYRSLRTLEPLRRGRSLTHAGPTLREGSKVRPVDPRDLDRVLEHCSPMLADMLRLQSLTAMRPSEIIAIRRRDIRRSVTHDCFEYVVTASVNKMEHEDRDRVVLLGDKAMEIVDRWCPKSVKGYVFNPRRAIELEYARRRASMKERKYRHQDAAVRLERARLTGIEARKVGEHYTADSYRRAIERACIRAGVDPIAPNRIRHTGATVIASATEVAVAREILGHADIRTTMRYVGSLRNKAAEYVKAHG